MEILTAAGLTALLQVIAIDLVLAGDNAVVIGLAAAGLPAEQREKASINMLARCVLGWEIEEDHKPIPFSQKACVRVLSAGTWIRAEVDAFAADRRNFLPEA